MTNLSAPFDPCNIEKTLDLLLRGVSQNDFRRIRDAWRALVAFGPLSTSAITAKLRKSQWKARPNGYEARYLMVLLSLLNEIDPSAARVEISRLSSRKIHPLHQITVKFAATWINDRPHVSTCKGFPIAISAQIANPDQVQGYIERWLNTPPPADLANITRIDVVSYQPRFDYLGQHNILFSGIVLVWPEPETNISDRWLSILRAETTLYHEIGHLALGHLEGGQVKEQEDEANKYARKRIRKNRRILLIVVILLGPIIFPLLAYRKYIKRKSRFG